MNIAIIGTMEPMIAALRDQLKGCQIFQHRNCEIYTGLLSGIKITLLKSGIGKVAAALGTTLLLDHYQPSLVINTGLAGTLSSKLTMGDIVISETLCYHDVDITAMGYPPGQLPNNPVSFKANRQLIDLARRCASLLNVRSVEGLIRTGDTFINSKEKKAYIISQFPQAIAVEMEAASIAHVCQHYQCPFVVVRSISDNANESAHICFDRFLNSAAYHACQLAEAMIKTLAVNPEPIITG